MSLFFKTFMFLIFPVSTLLICWFSGEFVFNSPFPYFCVSFLIYLFFAFYLDRLRKVIRAALGCWKSSVVYHRICRIL